jgi:hypothetical protein
MEPATMAMRKYGLLILTRVKKAVCLDKGLVAALVFDSLSPLPLWTIVRIEVINSVDLWVIRCEIAMANCHTWVSYRAPSIGCSA